MKFSVERLSSGSLGDLMIANMLLAELQESIDSGMDPAQAVKDARAAVQKTAQRWAQETCSPLPEGLSHT